MNQFRIAVGPELPEFGSWNWIASDIVDALRQSHQVFVFSSLTEPPDAEVTVFLKFKPASDCLQRLEHASRLIYIPVDVYDNAAQIEADRTPLTCFHRIIVHCPRLIRYFAPITSTRSIDHSLRYTSRQILEPKPDGDVLWAGRSCNMGSVVEWANSLNLDRRLRILTNDVADGVDARKFGFTKRNDVVIETWSENRHVTALESAIAGVDVKGSDFRSRHKPPSKVLDYLASGLPVIVNRGGSADLHLQSLGLTPLYAGNGLPDWESLDFPQFQAIAQLLRNSLNRMRVLERLRELLIGIDI